MSGVDIVIPSYQYGRYLRGCIRSVLDQGIDGLRVLVIDNASTDDSVEVAQQMAMEDRRVEVVARRRNLGANASYNEGVDWAASSYFVVLCADDYLTPGSLARSVAIMERHPGVGLAYGDGWQLFDHGPLPDELAGPAGPAWTVTPGSALLKRFCRTAHCPMFECAVMRRTSVQKRAGYYRRELPYTDDFELWMRFARLADVACTPAVQGVVRMHGGALSAAGRDSYVLALGHVEEAFDSFFAHEGVDLPARDRLQRLVRRSLAGRAYWSAVSHLCRGERGESRKLIQLARRLRPRTAFVPPVGSLLHRDDTWKRLAWMLSRMQHRAAVRS